MRCLLCENLSLLHICKDCQEIFLSPSIYKRHLSNGIEVLSFYKYQEIKKLLHTKHTYLGYYIYTILAQNSFQKFAQDFCYDTPLVSICVDDNPKENYSHTAILNKALKSKNIKPLYNILRATNSISYSGKSREFRLSNSKNFQVKDFKEQELLLVDDIITTGATLTQSIEALQKKGKETLLCLTLADASLK